MDMIKKEKISMKRLKNEYPDIFEYLRRKRQVVAYRRGNDVVEVVTPCDEISVFFKRHEFFRRREDKWSLSITDRYSADIKFDNQSVTITANSITELLYRLSMVMRAMVS
jgi:hypothetical protein